jgi:hypothetical protein
MVIRKGTRVKWRLGSGYGRGKVEASFKQKVSKAIIRFTPYSIWPKKQ